jgi:hypothetical protein
MFTFNLQQRSNPNVCFSNLDFVLTTTSYDNNLGPTFSTEPPARFDFTHTFGARVDCIANGIPTPNIEWLDSENNPVNSISSVIRQIN